ncbi:Glutamine amidotransferase, class I [hydrothermal vent metagenome]|uniref:Glutamine amidotransferase, class I n=1 Tax=hydrothermal vent metagenome TaxID=652676 RepID=A0A3B1BUU2_9ZZZZ
MIVILGKIKCQVLVESRLLTLLHFTPILILMAKSKAPVIGISADTNEGKEGDLKEYGSDTVFWLKKHYITAIEKSGGTPIILPVVKSPKAMAGYLNLIDGLLLSGGYFDISPRLYGESPMPQCGALKPDRTLMEIALFKKARKLKMPILGICGGLQAINVGLGGTLYQHIPAQVNGALPHEQKPLPSTKPSHYVTLAEHSTLRKIAGRAKIKVNSTHHQGIKDLGRGLVACAVAPDGIVEAAELKKKDGAFMVGVQWHPEALFKNSSFSQKLFRRFIAEAKIIK